MTMNKYATYRVFKHKTTGEVIRVAHTEDGVIELEKVSELENERCWIEMDADPKDETSDDDA
jgi:hypothetical protein